MIPPVFLHMAKINKSSSSQSDKKKEIGGRSRRNKRGKR
jgi:hypothetical protein